MLALHIWLHSIQVAVASQSIARMAAQLNVNLETAYLCGLLHDIGRFVLFNLVPDSILRIDEKDWDSPEELIDAEEDAIGTDHAKLGTYTAKKWTLPDKLVNVICNHHNYTYSETTQVDKYDTSLVKIVQIADSFSVLLMKHPDSLSLPPKELEELIEQHCFHPSWEERPIKAILLQNEAQKIYDKSLDLANGLGIMIDN